MATALLIRKTPHLNAGGTAVQLANKRHQMIFRPPRNFDPPFRFKCHAKQIARCPPPTHPSPSLPITPPIDSIGGNPELSIARGSFL